MSSVNPGNRRHIVVPATVAAQLAALRQSPGTRCAKAQFAVADDLPLRPKTVVRAEAGLLDAGRAVGVVFLGSDGKVYVQAYGGMSIADQVALGTIVEPGGYSSATSAVVPFTEPLPKGVSIEGASCSKSQLRPTHRRSLP